MMREERKRMIFMLVLVLVVVRTSSVNYYGAVQMLKTSGERKRDYI